MKFSLISYNLRYNKAVNEVKRLIKKYDPDILCFQEIATDEPNLKYIKNSKYKIADYSNSFIRRGKIFGVTTFYNSERFTLKKTNSFNLPTNLYQIVSFFLYGNRNPRTVLKSEFICKNNKKITIYNIHLTPIATNQLRIKQINNTFEDIDLTSKDAVIIAGDFNYPYGRMRFEQEIHKYNLKEATSNINYTMEKRILNRISVKLKLDYVLYKKLKCLSNRKLLTYKSDHFPILSTFDI